MSRPLGGCLKFGRVILRCTSGCVHQRRDPQNQVLGALDERDKGGMMGGNIAIASSGDMCYDS